MDTLLSVLALAGFLVAQIAAAIAVSAERRSRAPEAFSARFDHIATVIRNSGG
jgi:hypothetical protein